MDVDARADAQRVVGALPGLGRGPVRQHVGQARPLGDPGDLLVQVVAVPDHVAARAPREGEEEVFPAAALAERTVPGLPQPGDVDGIDDTVRAAQDFRQAAQLPLHRRVGVPPVHVDGPGGAARHRVVVGQRLFEGLLVRDAAEKQAAVEPFREIEDRLAAPDQIERGRKTAHVREVPLDARDRVIVADALPDGRDDLLRRIRIHHVQLWRVRLLENQAGIARQ